MINLKATFKDGVVAVQRSDSARIAKLWKKSVVDAVYVKSIGRNVRHRNPKTFNCINYTLHDLSIPKKDRSEPLEITIRFDTDDPTPKSISINHFYRVTSGSYKTNRSIEDLMKVISRIDILYSEAGGGIVYKEPFSTIAPLWEDLRKQLENACAPLITEEAP